MTLTAEQITRIEEFLGDLNTEVDVLNCIDDIENINLEDAYNSIYEMIEENQGFDIEIIYYSEAIKYLMEHDASLMDSLNIAAEYGFETHNLNSEMLASLHASQKVRDEFYELQDEIDEFFQELVDEAEREEIEEAETEEE